MPLAQILVWTAMGFVIGYAFAFARFQGALARVVATSEMLDRVVRDDDDIPEAIVDGTIEMILTRHGDAAAPGPPAPAEPVAIDTDRLWMLESSQRTAVPGVRSKFANPPGPNAPR